MQAYLHSVRIAPKKAALVAQMVRGMPVVRAIDALERTHKRGARIIVALLRSAVANAQHNDKQRAEHLFVKTIVANKADTLQRGVPIARGRWRPLKKYTSHISVTLGVLDADGKKPAASKKSGGKEAAESSQAGKTPVKKAAKAEKKPSKKSS